MHLVSSLLYTTIGREQETMTRYGNKKLLSVYASFKEQTNDVLIRCLPIAFVHLLSCRQASNSFFELHPFHFRKKSRARVSAQTIIFELNKTTQIIKRVKGIDGFLEKH